MNRKKKLLFNSVASLGYQLVSIICGFILPRFLLSYYGTETNGLVSSITQFLGFITLAECGVGAVVQSTLYKPLAENDTVLISKIFLSSRRFFKKVSYILLGYVGLLMLFYPLITKESFEYTFTMGLIFVIAISTFAQYYIGMSYKILLEADQLGFVQHIIHIGALIINTTACIVLMKLGATIHIVKLTTSLIFVMQPILLLIIAKRRYKLDFNVQITKDPIDQKWNGLAQHITGVVLVNTDVAVLTLFSTLENVSVYTVYHLVVNGIKQIVVSLTNGVRAMFGNMLAKNENEELNQFFDSVEWVLHTLVTFAFSVTSILILPFVRIYTSGITDANYLIPSFAYLITLAQASYCLRLPYYILVNAAGHYKQTQCSAIIEAIINVAVSVALVFRFGLIGVALGTFAAMAYRTVYLVFYLRKNILFRPLRYFVKHLITDILAAIALFAIVTSFPGFYVMNQIDYFSWFVLAVKVGLTALGTQILVNLILYGRKMKKMIFRTARMR